MRDLICVDFDGVLNQYAGDYAAPVAPPQRGVRRFLQRLNDTWIVVILTARETGQVWDWLIDHALEDLVDNVTNEKPPAHAYIDDRAIRFDGDFEATAVDAMLFRPYWEGGAGAGFVDAAIALEEERERELLRKP